VLNAAGGRIALRFHARDLHLIMGPEERRGAVPFECSSMVGRRARAMEVMQVSKATARFTAQRLYQLIRQPGPISERQFEIEFLGSLALEPWAP